MYLAPSGFTVPQNQGRAHLPIQCPVSVPIKILSTDIASLSWEVISGVLSQKYTSRYQPNSSILPHGVSHGAPGTCLSVSGPSCKNEIPP